MAFGSNCLLLMLSVGDNSSNCLLLMLSVGDNGSNCLLLMLSVGDNGSNCLLLMLSVGDNSSNCLFYQFAHRSGFAQFAFPTSNNGCCQAIAYYINRCSSHVHQFVYA